MFGSIILALAAAASALPTSAPGTSQLTERDGAFRDAYVMHWGDGSVGQGWTSGEDWASWDSLWNYNSGKMKQTCGWNGMGADNSNQEIADVKKAIIKYADQSLLDKRFILAIVMQESKGCVRAGTTSSPGANIRNPGLMQSHNGSGSCAGVNPCPYSQIDQMIKDGVLGTSSGDGLRQTLTKAIKVTGTKNSQAYYRAAREYNSGSITNGNLNDGRGATNCYVADVCNRLSGWLLNGKCTL